MDIILLEKIANLGNLGDRVSVRPGYGRNYLVPGKKAVPATKANIEMFEARRAELEKAAAETLGVAQARAEKLEVLPPITIASHASNEGKLFGSVGVMDIADAVIAAGIEIKKSEVSLPEGPIRNVGEYQIDIQLHSDATVAITVNVVAE